MKKILTLSLTVLALLLLGCSKQAASVEPSIDVDPGTDAVDSTMKIISYNILKGMSFDKYNKYNLFVQWVTKQAPDVMALQETNGFTQESLATLAKRWGHDYSYKIVGPSGYDVGLTSRYPITIVKVLEEGNQERTTRGVLHAKIKGINFVVLHLWPYSVYPQVGGLKGTGETRRLSEVTYIIDSTLAKNPTDPDWLFMGDFNCPSEYDKDDIVKGDWEYKTHNKMLSSGLYDLVHDNHNRFIQSCVKTVNRIDFIYGTRTIAARVVSADILQDAFTKVASDHYPVCAEIRYFEN